MSTEQFKCISCPEDSDHGIYPDCDCSKIGNGVYNQYKNECSKCPENSTGIYPNCTCSDKNAAFSELTKKCEFCATGSSGKIPNCICENGAGLKEFHMNIHFNFNWFLFNFYQ